MTSADSVTYDDGVMTVIYGHIKVTVDSRGTGAVWTVCLDGQLVWWHNGIDGPHPPMDDATQLAVLMALFRVQQDFAGGRLQSSKSNTERGIMRLDSCGWRVLGWFSNHDVRDLLTWHVADGRAEFAVICNDLWQWATADAEPISDDDIDALKQAHSDLYAAGMDDIECDLKAPLLWACRHRGHQPQRAWLTRPTPGNTNAWQWRFSPEVTALFQSAGPIMDNPWESSSER